MWASVSPISPRLGLNQDDWGVFQHNAEERTAAMNPALELRKSCAITSYGDWVARVRLPPPPPFNSCDINQLVFSTSPVSKMSPSVGTFLGWSNNLIDVFNDAGLRCM